jgi:glycosyltransferase involved in cell wall biosynthesis
MRILFFSHYFPPEGNAPASRTYENARRWVKSGHQVTVITCAPNCPDGIVYGGYKNKLFQREHIDGIDVRRVWTYIAANEGTVRRIINYVSYMISAFFFSLFVKRPDVVIATSPQFFCGWAGVLTYFFRRIPFILEIRDIWPESIVAVGAMRNKRLVLVLEWLEKVMYASAGHIVTVGEGYRRRLLEKKVSAEKISVVMNGVDRERFNPREPDEGLKRQYGVGDKFICSYSGTIGMACGLNIVLDAAQKLKDRGFNDIVFMLVGDGSSRKDLETQAKARQLDNVIFTGRQSKEKMPEYLAISDVCLVHLRKTDLFKTVMPSKIFESSGMAKPIINGVGGFAAEFIETAGSGINIEPENSDQLIDALMLLRNHASLRATYGNAGREYVTANFDRDKLAQDYLKIIDNMEIRN